MSGETQPLFTVATLCYNHETFLPDYFNGLLAQSYTNVQIIFHDDCSTDGSWKVVQEYLPRLREKFPEVIVERSEKNRGMWGSYLWLMEAGRVRGKYFSILESDDYYLAARIAKVVEYLETHPNCGVVHSGCVYKYEESGRYELYKPQVPAEALEGWLFETLLKSYYVIQCTIAFRTDWFRQIDLHAIAARKYPFADYPVSLAIARITPFGYIDEVLVCYRFRQGSASRPESERKRYEFERAARQAAVDAAVSADVSETVLLHTRVLYHQLVFREAFRLGSYDESLASLRWMRENAPDAITSLSNRLLALVANMRHMRELVRRVYFNHALANFRLKLYLLRRALFTRIAPRRSE